MTWDCCVPLNDSRGMTWDCCVLFDGSWDLTWDSYAPLNDNKVVTKITFGWTPKVISLIVISMAELLLKCLVESLTIGRRVVQKENFPCSCDVWWSETFFFFFSNSFHFGPFICVFFFSLLFVMEVPLYVCMSVCMFESSHVFKYALVEICIWKCICVNEIVAKKDHWFGKMLWWPLSY